MLRSAPLQLLALIVALGCAQTPGARVTPATSTQSASAPQASGGLAPTGWLDALIVDASSSASTLTAFQWRSDDRVGLPVIETLELPELPECEPVEPGLGGYGDRPGAAAGSLAPLIRCARAHLGGDVERIERAAFHVRATAGLRLLPEAQRQAVLAAVERALAAEPFGETSVRVISGGEEGVFGWLTVNYLLGHLHHGGTFPTVGALDLGGGSTQVTFVPVDRPREHAQTIYLSGKRYPLYTYSYLGLGQDQARERVDSPACFLPGYPFAPDRVGAGDYDACRDAIRRTLAKPCEDEPCSLFGVYQPPIYGDLLAFSVYYFTADYFGLSGGLSPLELEARAREFCATPWSELVAREPEAEASPYVPNYCFAGAYVVTLLTDGWGLAPTTDRVHAVRRIQGSRVGWTLGALLYELAGSSD